MPQMPTALCAHNLRPRHAKRAIRVPHNRARHRIEERRPAAARLELVLCGVEGRVAGGAVVGAGGGRVFVVFAGAGGFGAFFADDAELFCWSC
jgi:hypothetical protein